MPKTRFVDKFDDEAESCLLLEKYLKGRVFDFVYKTADCNQEFSLRNQRLLREETRPIRIERRGKILCLLFKTDGPDDDPFVSIPEVDSKIVIDFGNIDKGIIRITNSNGDWFEFRLEPSKNK